MILKTVKDWKEFLNNLDDNQEIRIRETNHENYSFAEYATFDKDFNCGDIVELNLSYLWKEK